MARKEVTQTTQQSDKKLRTKDLIYAGAFGAVYIVLMLIVVLGTSAIPVLYILAPFTVGVVCATVYELCVLKVHKFGAALILGVEEWTCPVCGIHHLRDYNSARNVLQRGLAVKALQI